jgi:hypothetical protein
MKAATAATLAVLLSARSAWPCASAPPRGHWVGILDEQALIVWDAEARQQHFVRRARFDADAPSFGFLVPTPTRPMLAEAPDAIFDALDRAVQPEIVTRTKWDVAPMLLCFSSPPPERTRRFARPRR